MKIILDTCDGSASVLAENVFKRWVTNFLCNQYYCWWIKINVNCSSTCLDSLKKAIKKFNAEIVFRFNEDADGVKGIDSEENILDCGHILFIWGRELMKENILSINLINYIGNIKFMIWESME